MNRRSGFTLVEMLVVISIIAVLVALLLPAISNAKTLARRAVCLSNLHSFGIGVGSYSNIYKDRPPAGFDGAIGTNRSGEDTVWVNGLTGMTAYLNGYWGPGLLVAEKFLDSSESLYCPDRRGNALWNDYGNQKAIFGATNMQAYSTYLHRNDNDHKLYGGLGINPKLSQVGLKSWVVDLGTFFYNHPTVPTASRWRNHAGGFNVLYLDGMAMWVADSTNALQYNGDGGQPTTVNSWGVFDSKR